MSLQAVQSESRPGLEPGLHGMGTAGGFFWWEGVVEDNIDPLGIGRCKVRIIGYNSPMKLEQDKDEFPWAYPIQPLNSPHGKVVALKPGTRVIGFFRDGANTQELVMIGTMNVGFENPGNVDNFDDSQEPVSPIRLASQPARVGEYGFHDDRSGAGGIVEGQPRKTSVTMSDGVGQGGRSTASHADITDYGPIQNNEINTPRLQRGIISGTISEAHAGAASVLVRNAFNGGMVEPANPYAALYPFNTVEESDSGHLREIDDTPGAERIKESHRSGTFYEIHPNGTKVTKVVNDEFSVTIGDKGVKVEGVCAVHVVGNSELHCEGDINAHGLKQINVLGRESVLIDSRGPMKVFSTGKMDIVSKNSISLIASGTISMKDGTGFSQNVDELQEDYVHISRKGFVRLSDRKR